MIGSFDAKSEKNKAELIVNGSRRDRTKEIKQKNTTVTATIKYMANRDRLDNRIWRIWM